MDTDALERIALNFHHATDGGLPVDCSGVPALEEQLSAWAREHHPEIFEDAGDLEAYLIDEEGIEAIGEFFTTISAQHVPTILDSLEAAINEYYDGTELEPESDPEHAAAVAALEAIAGLRKSMG